MEIGCYFQKQLAFSFQTIKLETMAGGKETPRQKMIGMMYLVLTALLALNVSKSILDAFVAIEENVQKANLTELYRGNERKSEIQETLLDKSEPLRASRAEFLMRYVDQIDDLTAKQIRFIDELKLKILEDCGENISDIGKEGSIIMEKYNPKNAPLKPIRMNLQHVEGKDKYDEPMNLLIQGDIKHPKGKGMELWNSLINYRKSLTELIASSHAAVVNGKIQRDNAYHFKAPTINSVENQKELDALLKKAIKAGNVHPEDVVMILEIYKSLTKEEYSEANDVDNVHWIGKTFDHSPSVAAIASLSSLQNDILKARANAMVLLRTRISGDSYSFNQILPLAYGPEVVNQGEEFQLRVMMVAYDSDKQPIVTMNGDQINKVQDGQGIVDLKGTSGTMDLKGTITIRNKAGIAKTMDWTKTVHVMKPSGSIEMPEFNILYRNYGNIINATASGFPETVLSGSGVNITKTATGYSVTPNGNGRAAQLVVSGKTADGKVTRLKTIDYRVSTLPKPTLYWGASESGESISTSNKVLVAKYPPEIPLNLNYDLVSWELSAGVGPPEKGNGKILSEKALKMVNSAPKGTPITVTTWVSQNGTRQKLVGTYFK